jgi:hypothetical protein
METLMSDDTNGATGANAPVDETEALETQGAQQVQRRQNGSTCQKASI